MRIVVCFALSILICPAVIAADGVIYKCVDRSRNVSFQNEPCPATHDTRSTRVYTDPGYNPDLARKVADDERAIQRRKAENAAAGSYSFGRPGQERPEVLRCRKARRERDDTLQRVGLKRTFDLLRRLDDKVYEACKQTPNVR